MKLTLSHNCLNLRQNWHPELLPESTTITKQSPLITVKNETNLNFQFVTMNYRVFKGLVISLSKYSRIYEIFGKAQNTKKISKSWHSRLRANVGKASAKLEMVIKNFPSYVVCSKTLVWNYLLWHLYGFWCKPALSTRGGSSGLKMQYFFPFFTIKLEFCYLNISKNIQLFKNLFVS